MADLPLDTGDADMESRRSMPPATRPAPQPRKSGAWRQRLLRNHGPLALASAVVIFLWMSLPLFQAAGHQGPPQAARQTSGHQGAAPAGGHTGGHQPPPAGTPAAGHQPPPAASTTPAPGYSGNQTANLDGMQNRLLIARFTTASGYVGLGLLALTLLIGPANLLLRRRNPISSYLTRDVGMWAALVSVVHVIAGFLVHGPPAPLGERILSYFLAPDGSPLTNSFGLANWTGLAATVIVVGLLALSNNFALRKLKAGPWKMLQRLNYALFALVIAHAIYYGALLRVTSVSTILLGLSVIVVLVGQAVGIRLWRRRHLRRGGTVSQQPG